MKLYSAEEPRYSIETLRALYYGATFGTDHHSTVRLLIEDTNFPTEVSILSVGTDGLSVRAYDGTIQNDIKLTRIIHAEVV